MLATAVQVLFKREQKSTPGKCLYLLPFVYVAMAPLALPGWAADQQRRERVYLGAEAQRAAEGLLRQPNTTLYKHQEGSRGGEHFSMKEFWPTESGIRVTVRTIFIVTTGPKGYHYRRVFKVSPEGQLQKKFPARRLGAATVRNIRAKRAAVETVMDGVGGQRGSASRTLREPLLEGAQIIDLFGAMSEKTVLKHTYSGRATAAQWGDTFGEPHPDDVLVPYPYESDAFQLWRAPGVPIAYHPTP